MASVVVHQRTDGKSMSFGLLVFRKCSWRSQVRRLRSNRLVWASLHHRQLANGHRDRTAVGYRHARQCPRVYLRDVLRTGPGPSIDSQEIARLDSRSRRNIRRHRGWCDRRRYRVSFPKDSNHLPVRPFLFFTLVVLHLLQFPPSRAACLARTVDSATLHTTTTVHTADHSSADVALALATTLTAVGGSEAGFVGVRDRSHQVGVVGWFRPLGVLAQERRVYHDAALRVQCLRGHPVANGVFGRHGNPMGHPKRLLDIRRQFHLHLLRRQRPITSIRKHRSLGDGTPRWNDKPKPMLTPPSLAAAVTNASKPLSSGQGTNPAASPPARIKPSAASFCTVDRVANFSTGAVSPTFPAPDAFLSAFRSVPSNRNTILCYGSFGAPECSEQCCRRYGWGGGAFEHDRHVWVRMGPRADHFVGSIRHQNATPRLLWMHHQRRVRLGDNHWGAVLPRWCDSHSDAQLRPRFLD